MPPEFMLNGCCMSATRYPRLTSVGRTKERVSWKNQINPAQPTSRIYFISGLCFGIEWQGQESTENVPKCFARNEKQVASMASTPLSRVLSAILGPMTQEN